MRTRFCGVRTWNVETFAGSLAARISALLVKTCQLGFMMGSKTSERRRTSTAVAREKYHARRLAQRQIIWPFQGKPDERPGIARIRNEYAAVGGIACTQSANSALSQGGSLIARRRDGIGEHRGARNEQTAGGDDRSAQGPQIANPADRNGREQETDGSLLHEVFAICSVPGSVPAVRFLRRARTANAARAATREHRSVPHRQMTGQWGRSLSPIDARESQMSSAKHDRQQRGCAGKVPSRQQQQAAGGSAAVRTAHANCGRNEQQDGEKSAIQIHRHAWP